MGMHHLRMNHFFTYLSMYFVHFCKCLVYVKYSGTINFFFLYLIKIFSFKIQDENNLSEQFFSLMKEIWWYENTESSNVSNNCEKYEQMSAEELSHEIYTTESKIEYLEVLNLLIINNKYAYELCTHKNTSIQNFMIYLLNV